MYSLTLRIGSIKQVHDTGLLPSNKKKSEKTVPIGKKCPSLIKPEKPKQDIFSSYYWLETWNHSNMLTSSSTM